MESYSREVDEEQKKADERLDSCAKIDEDMMDKFSQITSSVGTQLQRMNSSIVKMKEDDDRYKQFNERITNIEKSLTWMKSTKIEVKQPKENMWESRQSSGNMIPQ